MTVPAGQAPEGQAEAPARPSVPSFWLKAVSVHVWEGSLSLLGISVLGDGPFLGICGPSPWSDSPHPDALETSSSGPCSLLDCPVRPVRRVLWVVGITPSFLTPGAALWGERPLCLHRLLTSAPHKRCGLRTLLALSSPPPAGLRPACPRGVPEPDRASLPCGAATVLPAQPRNPPPELVPETAGRLGGWSLSLGRACVFPVPGAYQVLSNCLLKEGKVPRARTLHFRSRSYRLVEHLESNGVLQTRDV